jgi:hypothetical protein
MHELDRRNTSLIRAGMVGDQSNPATGQLPKVVAL